EWAEISALDCRFAFEHRRTVLALHDVVLTAVACRRHGQAQLIVIAAIERRCQHDAAADVACEPLCARIADTELAECRKLPRSAFVERAIPEQIDSTAASGAGVMPRAETDLCFVRRQSRQPAEPAANVSRNLLA